MKEPLKYIAFLFALLLISGGIYLVSIFGLTNMTFADLPLIYRTNTYYQWPGGDTYHKLKRTNEHFEVLVLGSSKAYRGLDCEILSEKLGTTLNLGTTAQDICGSFNLLKLFHKEISPQIIIIELSPVSFESDGFECSTNLASNGINYYYMLQSGSFMDFRIMNNFLGTAMRISPTSLYEKEGYQDCGSVMSEKSFNDVLLPKYGLRFKPKGEQQDCFLDLIGWIQKSNLEVYFVSLPIPNEIDREEHLSFISHISESVEMQSLNYIDLDSLDELNTNVDFYDHIHLNKFGAEKTTLELLRTISKKQR